LSSLSSRTTSFFMSRPSTERFRDIPPFAERSYDTSLNRPGRTGKRRAPPCARIVQIAYEWGTGMNGSLAKHRKIPGTSIKQRSAMRPTEKIHPPNLTTKKNQRRLDPHVRKESYAPDPVPNSFVSDMPAKFESGAISTRRGRKGRREAGGSAGAGAGLNSRTQLTRSVVRMCSHPSIYVSLAPPFSKRALPAPC
jgi:hypothetical protein